MATRRKPEPPSWPADKVERWPLDKLFPYARNARQHTPEQVAQIAASIREWGWTIPVLVNEAGELIAGHGRVLAARQLGIESVPTMTARGWSEAKIRAYRVADNRLGELSVWDKQLLGLELLDLKDLGADLQLIGFTANEAEALNAPETDPLAEWQGMPEFIQNSKLAYQTLAVHLKDAEAARAFAELIKQPISERTRFVWFPQAEIETYVDKQYAAVEDEA